MDEHKGINDLNLNDSATFSKTVTEADIVLFAGLTGDFNPIHINSEVGKRSKYGGRIAHGLLIAGYISTVLGTKLPGPGTIYLSQDLRFLRPVYIGDTITVECIIEKIYLEAKRVRLLTTARNNGNELILTGHAEVVVK